MIHTRTAVVLSAVLLLGGCSAQADYGSPAATDTTTLSVVPAANTTATMFPAVPAATTTPPATPVAVGSCDESAFLSVFDSPVVLFCDGSWAEAGQRQTDAIRLFQFQDGGWQMRQADGNSWPSNYPCHDEAALHADGAPAELIGQTLLCETSDLR